MRYYSNKKVDLFFYKYFILKIVNKKKALK